MTNRKSAIGAKLSSYRKQAGLTQAELAEKLGYSDKALSKWERGESLPDILTLLDLAALLDVPVQAFWEDTVSPCSPVSSKAHPRREILLALILCGIFALGLLSFVILRAFSLPGSWIGILYCLPVSALVGLIFSALWRSRTGMQFFLSCLIWGILLSVCTSLKIFGGISLWYLLLLGIPGQLAVWLSFRIQSPDNRKEHSHG